MPYRFTSILSAAALSLAPQRVTADPRSFLFQGTVVSLDDEHGLLGPSGAPGAPFSLLTTFESATADSEPDPALGAYYNAAPQGELELLMGPHSWRSRDLLTAVADGAPTGSQPPAPAIYDAFRQEATFDTLAQGQHWGLFVQIFLLDETGSALDSPGLPGAPPDPSRFGSASQLLVTGGLVGEDGYFTLIASVTSSSTPLVPTPAGLILLAGIAGRLAAQRRR